MLSKRIGGRLSSWRGGVLAGGAAALVAVCAAVAVVGMGFATPGDGTAASTAGTPVPAAQVPTIVAAAGSCPTLTPSRLAAQLMAASGFGRQVTVSTGGHGIAALSDAAWHRWQPWSGAVRTDPDASILGLAHDMCDLVGQLRAAKVPGDRWRLALAAYHSGMSEVVASRGVPGSASGYVETVAAYADWYGQQPDLNPSSPTATQGTQPRPAGSSTSSAPIVIAAPTGAVAAGETRNGGPAPAQLAPTPAGAAAAPAEPTPPTPVATRTIVSFLGRCVDVTGARTDNWTPVELFTCNNTSAQRWTFMSDGTLRALGKCLDVANGATYDGARVQLYDCNGTEAQQWRYSAGYDLVNVQANKCLDVTGGASYDSVPLQIWDCAGTVNQKWSLVQ